MAQPCCVQSAYRSALEQLLLRPPAQFSRAVLTQAGGPVRQATLASRCTCCSTLWTDVSTMSNTAHTVAGMPAPAKSGSPVPTPVGDSHAVTKRLQSELMAMMTSGDAGEASPVRAWFSLHICIHVAQTHYVMRCRMSMETRATCAKVVSDLAQECLRFQTATRCSPGWRPSAARQAQSTKASATRCP